MAEIAVDALDLHTVGVADESDGVMPQHRLDTDYSRTAATTIRFFPSPFAL